MGFWSKKKTSTQKEAEPRADAKAKSAATSKDPLAGVRHIIAVASGKGGVGKSTVASNLAKTLQKRGFKVALLDADIYGPSLPTMLPCEPPSKMRDELVVPPEREGLAIVSAEMFSTKKAHIMRGPMAGNFVKQLLLAVDWGQRDYLIIDYPPGTGDIQLSLSQSTPLRGAIIVTSPQKVALADVKKACEFFRTVKVPMLGVVETMSWFECGSCSEKHFIFGRDGGTSIAKEFAIPLLGQIPLDSDITAAADAGQPVVASSKSLAAKYFDAIGEQVLAAIGKSDIEQRTSGLGAFSLKWQ